MAVNHAINLTHDGTLILRIPKGYKVDKVVVEEMGTENRVEYQPTHPTPSNTLDALDCVDRQAAIDAIEQMQLPIMRSDFFHEQFIFRGLSEALAAIKELPSVHSKLEKNSKELENKNGELISRQAAMKIRFSSGFDHDGILFIPYRDVEEHLKKLPSVQTEEAVPHRNYK